MAFVKVAELDEIAVGEGAFIERDRHPVKAVDGDRLLAALDLSDELAGETGAITEPLLAESALLAERPQPLPEELPYVFHRAFAHGWLP